MNTLFDNCKQAGIYLPNTRTAITTAVSTLAVAIVVEHICDINEVNVDKRPSAVLKMGSTALINGWEKVGRICATISSWPKHLHLDRLVANGYNVCAPTVKMCLSPLWTLSGYQKQLVEVYNTYPGTVILGSIIIVGSIIGGICWYTGVHKKLF